MQNTNCFNKLIWILNSKISSIRNATPIDIKTIGITGKKASSLFDKYLLDKVNIRVVYLPSTSPANAKMKIEDLVEEYYKRLFD